MKDFTTYCFSALRGATNFIHFYIGLISIPGCVVRETHSLFKYIRICLIHHLLTTSILEVISVQKNMCTFAASVVKCLFEFYRLPCFLMT